MSTQIEKFTAIADKIREKTGTTDKIKPNEFAAKINDVYEAGQHSMIDRSKIIEGTLIGTTAVYANDVSEIPHNISVTLTSDTLTDFSDTSVTTCGKNIFNPALWNKLDNVTIQISDNSLIITNSNTATATIEWDFRLAAGTYTFTNNNPSGGASFYFYNRTTESDNWSSAYTVASKASLTKNIDTSQYVKIRIFVGVGQTIFNIPQIEAGSVSTAFEEYNGKVYTANADGTVDGLKSISPYMHIISDKDVTIKAEYYKSYGTHTQLNRIWKSLQNYGMRTDYTNAFAYSEWDSDSFKPLYNIKPSSSSGDGSASCLFKGTIKASSDKLIDMESIENECGITFDFSTCNNLSFAFADAGALKKLNVIDVRKCNVGERLNYTFYGGYGSNIECINKIICDENSNFVSTTFDRMTKLKEIRFDGVIGKSGITFALSKNLSHDSIKSIIDSLSETTKGLTITLSETAVNNAFEEAEWEELAATKTNWTISLI